MEPWRVTRFGSFELDRVSRELRKNGVRIHLQEQPLAILELLLDRAGQLASRSELQRRLWPQSEYGDFERGLNAAVTRLRQALNDSAAAPRYFETIPRRGYRFVAPVAEARQAKKAASGEPQRLMVLPFQQLLPDPETSFLCFSLPDAIMSSLAGVGSLVIVSNRLAKTSDLEALAEGGVSALLSGTLLRSGNGIRVSTQLVEIPTGNLVWTQSVEAALGEWFWLQDELMRRILESLMPSVAKERMGGPANARAYDYFLRGNQLAHEMRDLPLAREFFRRCLDEDPNYAPAWGRLARCYRILAKFGEDGAENLAQAEAAFARAFALQEDLPGIHGLYALHETEQGRAPEAIARLVRCLRNNRYDPELYVAMVSACRYAGLIDASRRRMKRGDGWIRGCGRAS